MLKVSNLTKTFYGQKQPVLKDVSFEVQNGEIYGLIGKNGAGKSTIIKCITGILPFEQGVITINKKNIKTDDADAKALIGYVPDNHSVYENLTGREYVNFMADIYGVDQEQRDYNIEKYSKMLNLENSLDIQIKGYSHGMKQKICIMGALVHQPKLWILDEPFLGLDYLSIQKIKECINYYARNKKHMVIFSSHNVETIIELCDKVCIVNEGVIESVFEVDGHHVRKKIEQALL